VWARGAGLKPWTLRWWDRCSTPVLGATISRMTALICDAQHNNIQHKQHSVSSAVMISVSGYAECRISFIVMLSVVMPSVIMLSVTFHLMLCSVSLMSVIMLIVLAQCDTTELPLCYFMTHCHWMYNQTCDARALYALDHFACDRHLLNSPV